MIVITEYTVVQGDTLYGISNQFGVSAIDLANLNNVKAETLQIGQILKIPSSFGTNPNTMFMYTVKKGDNLYAISKKYLTTVDEIMKLNNLKTTSISIGQVLRIPEMYTKEEDMYMPSYTSYTVKNKDTLYSIAKQNNIDIDLLKKDNALTNNILHVGQILKIRVPSNTYYEIEECFGNDYTKSDTYIVQKGDNLYSISKKFNTSVDTIKKKNNLTTNILSIGQKLII